MKTKKGDWIIRLENASIRPLLPHYTYSMKSSPIQIKNITWSLNRNENWLIYGPNGCGKSTLVKSLCGKAIISSGILESKIKTYSYVSFTETEKVKISTNNVLNYGGDLSEENLTVRTILSNLHKEKDGDLYSKFSNYEKLSHRNLSSLSSGEISKILITVSLLKKPELLVLDEPFDFLDESSRGVLKQILNSHFTLQNDQTRVVLITHRKKDIEDLTQFSHFLSLDFNGIIKEKGEINSDARVTVQVNEKRNSYLINLGKSVISFKKEKFDKFDTTFTPFPIVEIQNTTLKYEGKEIMTNVNFKLYSGNHIQLNGPSGSGKSLFLSLISGENPQNYSNDVRVFGKYLGQETLAERRKYIGYFSSNNNFIHFHYKKNITAYEILLSAVMETDEGKQIAALWTSFFLACFELKENQSYLTFSQGQRLVLLLVRSIIHSPKLLLLDEPFVGLDKNMRIVMKVILKYYLEQHPSCAVISTSHYQNDFEDFPIQLYLRQKTFDGPFSLLK